MYIVTSKPKRNSVYSGLLHMVFSKVRVSPMQSYPNPAQASTGNTDGAVTGRGRAAAWNMVQRIMPLPQRAG